MALCYAVARRAWRSVLSFAMGVILAGCSAALDWREAGLTAAVPALLPCKPERAERAVPLLGPQAAPVTLRMASCAADGVTWAVAEAALPAAASAEAALTAWQRASWATLGLAQAEGAAALPPGWAEVPCVGRGATLQRCLRGPGRAPDGRAVMAELHWSAREGWIVQAAAYAPPERAPTPLARETFFGALVWRGAVP